MDKKKILIVSASFYPQNSPRSFRTTELAKELSRQGHDVTVCIPAKGNDYTSFEIEHGLTIIDLGKLKWKEPDIKGSRIEQVIRKGLRRVLMLLFEWPNIELVFKVAKALKNKRGYDLLISIAVPHPIHWGVSKARKKHRKIAECWVADCGDPYMGNTIDTFSKPFYFKYLEKCFCRKADYITVPVATAIAAYYPEFRSKFRVIPQGFQLDNLKIQPFRKVFNYPVFAYAGSFIPGKRDPSLFLDFLSTCDRNFKFIVYTSHFNLFQKYLKILGEKLEIRQIIPREKLIEILAKMDFIVNFDNNTETMLPSKLIDYAIAGRPVLNISSNINSDVIMEFMDGIYKRRMNLPDPNEYDISLIAEKFIRLLTNS